MLSILKFFVWCQKFSDNHGNISFENIGPVYTVSWLIQLGWLICHYCFEVVIFLFCHKLQNVFTILKTPKKPLQSSQQDINIFHLIKST